MSVSANNKRIAKNTIMLYCRMAVTMGISIFSTRVLLQALGVSDYGLVNVIGGAVTMFGFISGTMNTATSRYITFELGKNNFTRLKQVFNLSQLIFIGLIFILFLLSETVGLWFFQTHLVLPPERTDAAFWFFQFAVASFLLGIANTPYAALVIAHENMKAFEWVSIFEAFARLGIIYVLYLSSFDHLIFYGALLTLVSLVHFAIYFTICRVSYRESRFAYYFEKSLFKSLLSFGGWNLWGAISGLFTNVFVNVLLNNYFGSIANAARGIASQVASAATSFTANFLTAVNPQITKYYAADKREQSYLLTMRASRFGFFLMYFIALPAWILCPFILNLWLESVPAHTVWFVRLILLQLLIDSLSYPLMTIAQASGRIALYQSIVGGMLWLNLPFTWLAFYFGAPPESFGFVAISISIVCLFLRLVLVRRCSGLPFWRFVYRVLVPVTLVAVVAAIVPAILNFFLFENPGVLQFFVIGFACVFSSVPAILFLGVFKEERVSIFNLLKTKIPLLK